MENMSSFSEIMNSKDNNRTTQLCQKLDEFSTEDKKAYFAKIIEEWAYNQTSNPPKNLKITASKKRMRKKTKEELKLLEYFLEQDPKWTRKTVTTAAKVLGLTTYQVYKWGYDRKNKREMKWAPQFLKELEITNSMIDKINKFDNEIKGENEEDLNKKVEDLFVSTVKRKDSKAFRTEIPIGELSLHQDMTNNSIFDIDTDYSPFDAPSSRCNGPFKVTKVSRHLRLALKSAKNSSTNLPKVWNFDNFNQSSEYQKYKDHKIESKDMMERYSDITNDKSSASSPLESEVDGPSPFQFENPTLSK